MIQRSRPSDYHSQRNNTLIPHASCNTTAMVMALKQAGYLLPFPSDVQPEDYLTEFLLSERSYATMYTLAPWAFDRSSGEPLYRPNEVHVMLRWAVNTLLGGAVDSFATTWIIEDLCRMVGAGAGVVVSGVFPSEGGELNHMVSLAGYAEDMSAFLIDDPYGDFHTGYRDYHGNDVVVTREEMLRIFKVQNSRRTWAHVIRSAKG